MNVETRAMLGACVLCPKMCRVNRAGGRAGVCGAGTAPRIFRWAAHDGEEPPVSGERGSGTVFLGGCSLSCVYCQNYPWSQDGQGTLYSPDELADVLVQLRDRGCHNWNLVTPAPWLPQIREAAQQVRAQGGKMLPWVYNTSSYERCEMLREYRDLADIYLADLRYATAQSAGEGSGAADYVTVARAALRCMMDLAGPLECDADGIAVRGVICRILVLPGRADEAMASLKWLADALGTQVPVSLMAQYTPAGRAVQLPGWDRRILQDEYERVVRVWETLGFESGWIQEYELETEPHLIGYQMPAATLNNEHKGCGNERSQ